MIYSHGVIQAVHSWLQTAVNCLDSAMSLTENVSNMWLRACTAHYSLSWLGPNNWVQRGKCIFANSIIVSSYWASGPSGKVISSRLPACLTSLTLLFHSVPRGKIKYIVHNLEP